MGKSTITLYVKLTKRCACLVVSETVASKRSRIESKGMVQRPGIESGSPAWQASILPLDHRCCRESAAFQFNPYPQMRSTMLWRHALKQSSNKSFNSDFLISYFNLLFRKYIPAFELIVNYLVIRRCSNFSTKKDILLKSGKFDLGGHFWLWTKLSPIIGFAW